MKPSKEKMPRLVAKLEAQFADLSACGAQAESAKLEGAITENLRGMGLTATP